MRRERKGDHVKNSFVICAILIAFSLAAASAAAEDNLAPGTPVWAPVSHAEWGHGVIQSRTAAGYVVKLDDGEAQDFDQENIALDSVPQVKDLTSSGKVIAKLSYGWFAGKILGFDGDAITVVFEDATSDQTTVDNVRMRLAPRPVSVAAAPAPASPSRSTSSGSPDKAATGTAASPAATAPASDASGTSDALAAANALESPGSVLAGILSEARNKYTWVFSLKKPAVSKTLKFGDKSVDLEFIPMDEKQVDGPYTWSFWITNKTGAPISINWTKSFLTSIAGKQRAIYHGDMKSVSSGPQANTVVPAGAKIGDAVTPREGVIIRHNKAHFDQNGDWVEAWDEIDGYQVFFGEDFKGADEYDQVRKLVVGKEFKFSLALVIAGAPKQYEFVYRIEDITKVTDTTPSPLDAIK
jgi:hypothetical protein